MWFVGWAAETDEDFSRVGGWKFKNTSKGVEFRPLTYTAADFDSLSAQADQLKSLVDRLSACLMIGKTFEESFIIESDGSVREPPPPSKTGGD